MTEVRNLGNAIVIIACMYFLINENFGIWAKIGIFAIILMALITWGIYTHPKENKDYIETKINVEKARILNFNAGTRQLLVQTELLRKGLRN